MSQVAISGNASGTGTLTIAAPNTNSNYTLNLPAATGTVMVSGNMPAFSAYNSGTQNLTTSTWTKATLGLEYFDTNNNFDSTTNYRFTPTVAGYYQLNGAGFLQSASNNISFIAIAFYKNGGTTTTYGSYGTIPNNNAAGVVISDLIYFNGSSDYVEMYIYATGTSPFTSTMRLSGSMVRSA
jgi:hypothetical protein